MIVFEPDAVIGVEMHIGVRARRGRRNGKREAVAVGAEDPVVIARTPLFRVGLL